MSGHRQSGDEDIVSLYKMGSSALFGIKRATWKKIKFKPRKKEMNRLESHLNPRGGTQVY